MIVQSSQILVSMNTARLKEFLFNIQAATLAHLYSPSYIFLQEDRDNYNRAYSLLLILIIGNTVGGYEYYLLSNFSAEKSVC